MRTRPRTITLLAIILRHAHSGAGWCERALYAPSVCSAATERAAFTLVRRPLVVCSAKVTSEKRIHAPAVNPAQPPSVSRCAPRSRSPNGRSLLEPLKWFPFALHYDSFERDF